MNKIDKLKGRGDVLLQQAKAEGVAEEQKHSLICKKCGRMLDDTQSGTIVITSMPGGKKRPLLHSSLSGSQVSFLYHRDICDGAERINIDPVKILSERNLLLRGINIG